jgi:YVTN family beta-propeller protein
MAAVHQKVLSTSSAPDNEYVALGDSYSSGEGLESEATYYIPPSNSDGCHRSTKAYPELLATRLGLTLKTFNKYQDGTQPFVACSGATTGESADASFLNQGSGSVLSGGDGEPSQLDALSPSTKYVTLTVGGNDLGFATILGDCMDITGKLGPVTYTDSSAFSSVTQCDDDLNEANRLLGNGEPGTSLLESALASLYSTIIKKKAPNADLVVLNYPQIFTTTPPKKFCPVTGGVDIAGTTWYASLSSSHINDLDTAETQLNSAITAAVQSSQEAGLNVHLVDINSGTQTEAIPCNTKTNGDSDINTLKFAVGSSLTDIIHDCHITIHKLDQCPGLFSTIEQNIKATESFHPKESLHKYMASQVRLSASVVQTIPVGDEPSGISSDGTHVWVANYGDNTVSELDASTGAVIQTIPVGDEPSGISSDGTHVWVTNLWDDTVSEIDASTGAVVQTITVGSEPYGVSSDGTHVWVANYGDNTVSELDASTGSVVKTIAVGTQPWDVSSDGTHVWVANSVDDTVSELDASTGSVVKTIAVGTQPWDVSSDGTHVWVANSVDDTVSELDASTGSVVQTIAVGTQPLGVSSDGTHVWVANSVDDTVSELDASTGSVVKTIAVGTQPLGVSSDGTHVWVANFFDNTVSELDA